LLACAACASVQEVFTSCGRCVQHFPLEEYRMSRRCWMRLTTPLQWWGMFLHPLQKNHKGVLFVILIIFDHSSFNYIKFHLFFFQLYPLTFDFYINFVLLFYDVSWLTLDVLISNLDYWLFYEILISFQFRPWTYDLIFIFFILGPRSLDFYFCFEFFCEFGFSFQFYPSIQIFMVFTI
jgi:hypothetical protein